MNSFKKVLCFLLLALALALSPARADGPLRQMLRQHMQQKEQAKEDHSRMDTATIAGLSVAYWLPDDAAAYPAPLIIFSHGFTGCKTQSVFLMQALADNGYIVVAPDHQDAWCGGRDGEEGKPKAEESFRDAGKWSDKTYADRADDIKNLYAALKEDDGWNKRIDWSKVGLAGHSLGGYTVLGLGGAWPGWKMDGVKAVLALSPYCQPFVLQGTLPKLKVPVMYQGGTRDAGITPGVKREGGAFDQTPAPAWFVDFEKTGHFGFTDLQKSAQQPIIDYSVWFFDHTLKGKDTPFGQEDGVAEVKAK